jgi:ubiquinone/menaquinone biosynthesis C-methylase UbiE
MLKSAAHALVSHPWVYDKVQRLVGSERVFGHLAPHVKRTQGDVVLDIGGGTGNVISVVPSPTDYIWLDSDPLKLQGFRRKHPLLTGIIGDATSIPLKDKSVDDVLCTAVLHHLTNEQLPLFFQEAARVARKKLILLDAVERKTSIISRMLWKYDRGSHPRTVEALSAAMSVRFAIEQTERFEVLHEYLICIGRPL